MLLTRHFSQYAKTYKRTGKVRKEEKKPGNEISLLTKEKPLTWVPIASSLEKIQNFLKVII